MNILMYTGNLNVVNGGVTYALINRANHLCANHKIHIFTHLHCTEEQVELDGVKVQNLHDYIAKRTSDAHLIDLPTINYENEVVYKDVVNDGNCRVFSQGTYRQYRGYQDGVLKTIDYFGEAWNRVEKAFLNNGEITRLVSMTSTNKPSLSRYIKDGKCYLTTTMKDWKDEKAFDHTRGVETTISEIKYHYIKEYLIENEIDTVFIDKREDVKTFLKLKKEIGLKLYFFLHSNHYHDYNKKGVSHDSLDDVKNNLSYIEKIIVLTNQQKVALDLEWGVSDKTVVISNVINYQNLENTMPDRKHFISIGRYAPVKNMIDMIRAIRIVSQKYPDVCLDLYGYGPDKDILIKEAQGLNVSINGFCNNAQELMAKSSGYLMTSRYEGQPLVLLEAYDSHTPIFSYNCDFGPADIVNEFDNGILIRSKTPEELANRMLDYIDETLNFEFTRSVDEDFSMEEYSTKINAMLN